MALQQPPATDTNCTGAGAPPSLLVLILDTNPYAWSALTPYLTLSSAVSQLLIFLNAHLAFNNANRVAVLASHTDRSQWLYPSPSSQMNGVATQGHSTTKADANKYRPFSLLEQELLDNLRSLLSSTTPGDLTKDFVPNTRTHIAGALTQALSYINRLTLALTPASANAGSGHATSNSTFDSSATAMLASTASLATHVAQTAPLNSRILIVSTSGDLSAQYIPLMNVIFAAQHSRIPIDVLKLAGDTVLLQQASYTTSGIFLSPVALPASLAQANDSTQNGNDEDHTQLNLLPTLLHAFLPDPLARTHLIPATGLSVDFRAACFCHRKVVDIGYVCSICLSIFCEQIPLTSEGGGVAGCVCYTCGTKLRLSDGAGLAASALDEAITAPRKKKKKRPESVAATAG